MNDVQAFFEGPSDQQVLPLDELARCATIELFELPDEMGLVGIGDGGDLALVRQVLR